MTDSQDLDALFPESSEKLRLLRSEDHSFDEICTHLELLIAETTKRFGVLDRSTADLMASFDDLRREVEKRLAFSGPPNGTKNPRKP